MTARERLLMDLRKAFGADVEIDVEQLANAIENIVRAFMLVAIKELGE